MKIDMGKFKGGIDIQGWIGCVILVGGLWLYCLWDPLHDYFIPAGGTVLAKLVTALLGTIIVWSFYLLSGNRNWLEAQQNSIDWGANKAVEIVKEMEKIGIHSFKEVHNIGIESSAEPFDVSEGIGED